jgi:hypothetical protein
LVSPSFFILASSLVGEPVPELERVSARDDDGALDHIAQLADLPGQE